MGEHDPGELWTVKLPVVFQVAARNWADARTILDRALTEGGITDSSVSSRVPYGEGILGWSHKEQAALTVDLPRSRYRSYLADLASVEVLRALVGSEQAHGLSHPLGGAELEQLRMTLAAADRFCVIADPDDPDVDPLFQGHASEAFDTFSDGVYLAHDAAGQEMRIVVGPSRFAPGGRAAASLPAENMDARALDTIELILARHARTTPTVATLQHVSEAMIAAGRDGVRRLELQNPAVAPSRPRTVGVGVIVWSDDQETEPTIIISPRIVQLTREVATMVWEELHQSDAFQGAEDFLVSHLEPADWGGARQVDEWLDALSEAMPFPQVTLTQLPVDGSGEGHQHQLADALSRRAAELDRTDRPSVDGHPPDLGRNL